MAKNYSGIILIIMAQIQSTTVYYVAMAVQVQREIMISLNGTDQKIQGTTKIV
jgi:redox-regulated HSP33 family molecular chaperone